MDIFNKDDKFFIMDSRDLSAVRTALYGFCVKETGIIENGNLDGNTVEPGGSGAYVYIRRQGGSITVCQDFNGCYGLFLYRNGSGFVLSNSLFYLAEYLKDKCVLTVNRDYVNYFLAGSIVIYTVRQTIFNEIIQLNKDCIVDIDAATSSISFRHHKEETATVDIGSPEAFAILDAWYNKWRRILLGITANTSRLAVALSGGFDSRVTFMIAKNAGIDLNGIYVNSNRDGLKTHTEDYRIACMIADRFGFTLNNTSNYKGRSAICSLEDIINISYYSKLSFHKQMKFKNTIRIDKQYLLGGYGGGIERGYWQYTNEQFLREELNRANKFGSGTAGEVRAGIRNILSDSFRWADMKHGDSSPFFYRETRCRTHFGRATVEDYCANLYQLSPLIDQDLSRIRLSDERCPDGDLLFAVLFTRHCPELLSFPFEGGRSIDPATVEYAKELNRKHPFAESRIEAGSFSIVTEDASLRHDGAGNRQIPVSEVNSYCYDLFCSADAESIFTSAFSRELYKRAKNYTSSTDYHPLQECHGVLSAVEALSISGFSKQNSCTDLARSLSLLSSAPKEDAVEELLMKYLNNFSARVDIKNEDAPADAIEITGTDDRDAVIAKPRTMQKNGVCYTVTSYKGSLTVDFMSRINGDIKICLRSKDVRDSENERIPLWLTYSCMSVNDEVIFSENRDLWHDKPFIYTLKARDGGNYTLKVEWSPCFYHN